MKLNIELLDKIKQKILEEPRRLDMCNWIQTYTSDELFGESDLPPCGTTACIAGWAHIINTKSATGFHFYTTCKALGFDYNKESDFDLTKKLFYDDLWDDPYNQMYARAETPEEKAEIVVQYIDYFIRTYGDQVVST